MRYLLFVLGTLFTLTSFTQTNNSCSKVKARGYTQEFCDYDKKKGYKNIRFGTALDALSTRFNLSKRETNPYDYECKDDEARFWGNVKFDQCLFEFNSEKKLQGVQLQMIGHGETDTEKRKQNMATWSRIEDYLTNLFGKPEEFNASLLWRGENVYIVLGGYRTSSNKDGSGALAIFTKNFNPVDDL